MSDQSPPSPPPPPSYPSFPPGHDGPPPRKDTWKLWVGIALAVPYLLVVSLITALVGQLDGGAGAIVAMAGFLAPIGLLFSSRTVKYGLGLLIGYAVLLVVGAGACVAFVFGGGLSVGG